ncbi:MAG: RNA methyltransferase [Desulfarculus sp.]|nr:MAG: RNA methyltransferase [Desulfarculus sp.]
MPDINLERRCKRQAWAPTHRFFAVTAPGLEPLCAAEMAALGLAGVEPVSGGVHFAGRLEAAYQANLWLRIAGRVLLRLRDFRVRRWEDLERQAASVPWEVWLTPGAPLRVQVALHQSNLKHSGRVEEVVLSAAAARLAELGLDAPTPAAAGDEQAQSLLVRGQERRASLSLDTSGPHLHKRGWRAQGGTAPLREDLAAALLLLCGYDGSLPLLDPLCGAGTLAIEAALLARRLPPGGQRGFAFENWPCHRAAAWQHLKAQAGQGALASAPAAILARDHQARPLALAQENAALAGVAADVTFNRDDFFTAPPPAGPGLLVMNPPYGKRLGSVRQARDFMDRLGQRLRAAYPGWRCGVVLYRPEWAGLLGLKEEARLAAPFGGLKVTLLCGSIPRE